MEEHLHTTLGEARANGCVFSIKKFHIGKKVVTSGFLIDITDSTKGIQISPDPSRVQALRDLPRPQTKKQVQSLLGLAVQLARFNAAYAHITPHLRQLTHKKANFIWEPVHEEEFNSLKEKFGNPQLLRPYDPKKPLFALTDASFAGLAFILLQQESDIQWSVVQVGSTTLKGAQSCWNPSELELLAVYYMLSKANTYTCNTQQEITVYSDCVGIKNLKTTPLTKCPTPDSSN